MPSQNLHAVVLGATGAVGENRALQGGSQPVASNFGLRHSTQSRRSVYRTLRCRAESVLAGAAAFRLPTPPGAAPLFALGLTCGFLVRVCVHYVHSFHLQLWVQAVRCWASCWPARDG